MEKRGGNLCAPVPSGQIGKCDYINDIDRKKMVETMGAYKNYVIHERQMARGGLGVEMHCHDVGLQDPSTVIQPGDLDTVEKLTAKALEKLV